jgi:hypothetical protein
MSVWVAASQKEGLFDYPLVVIPIEVFDERRDVHAERDEDRMNLSVVLEICLCVPRISCLSSMYRRHSQHHKIGWTHIPYPSRSSCA